MSTGPRRRVEGRGRSRGQVPVVLVSGVDEAALGAAAISLQLTLPGAVAVRHRIDSERQVLTRIVSDITGVLEQHEINLAHACVACAVREDIVPTLERLGAQGAWDAVVACLPVAAEADQVCRVLQWSPLSAPHVTIAAVVAALDGDRVADDVLGDDLLAERGLATSFEDRRGVGEVASAMVEYADLVCTTSRPGPQELALLAALARPRAPVLRDTAALDGARLLTGRRQPAAVEAWVADVRRGALPPLPQPGAWRLDLCSDRPFHPLRFQDELPLIGGGPRRSRGCFWLPTRPGTVCVWDGAGGQASVGSTRPWGREIPMTRITVVGIDDDVAGRAEIVGAFHRCLLTDDELATRGHSWDESWDGLEPWLGPIANVA